MQADSVSLKLWLGCKNYYGGVMDKQAQMYLDLDRLLKTIPKEHKKTVKKLAEIYVAIGEKNVLELVKQLGDIPPGSAYYNCVATTDQIDGG
jgi:hypothetical protein